MIAKSGETRGSRTALLTKILGEKKIENEKRGQWVMRAI